MRPLALSARATAAAIIAMALPVLLAWGCATFAAPPATKAPYVYLVGAGDDLTIEVFDEPKLKADVTVTPDGHVTFPLAGIVAVGDRTLGEIGDAVAARLVASKYFADPAAVKVAVTLKESKSAQVQIVGEVGKQGPVKFHDRLSLVEAINATGGIDWRTAKTETVRIVRGALDDPLCLEVDLDDVLTGGDRDPFLRPGDIVVVPAKVVTRMDRYVEQALSPIRSIVSTGASAAASGAAGGA